MNPEYHWNNCKLLTGQNPGLACLLAAVPRLVTLLSLLNLLILLCAFFLLIPSVKAENTNHQQLQSAMTSICSNLEGQANLNGQQLGLLDSCASVEVGVDQGFVLNLERLVTEEAFIFQDSIISLSDVRTNNMLRRLNQLRYPVTTVKSSQPVSHETISNRSVEMSADDSTLDVYVQARTLIGQYETSGLQMDHDSYAFAVGIGADYRIQPGLLAGLSLGFTRQETDFFNIDGDAYANVGNLSLYGSWLKRSIGYADVLVDVAYHRFNLRRKVNFFDESRQFALGKTDAFSAALVSTVGRDFSLFGFDVGPYLRLALMRAEIDGYRETVAEDSSDNSNLLRVRSHTADSRRLAVGGQFSREFGRRVKLIPQLRLEVVKEFVDEKSALRASFQADTTNTTITIDGDQRDTTFANSALGLELKFRSNFGASAFVVSRWLDDQYLQHWIKLGIETTF